VTASPPGCCLITPDSKPAVAKRQRSLTWNKGAASHMLQEFERLRLQLLAETCTVLCTCSIICAALPLLEAAHQLQPKQVGSTDLQAAMMTISTLSSKSPAGVLNIAVATAVRQHSCSALACSSLKLSSTTDSSVSRASMVLLTIRWHGP
jgi:hypothetical protein